MTLRFTGASGQGDVYVSTSAPLPVSTANSPGSANMATGQSTVATAATLIAAARATRNAITVTNTGTTPVYIGGSGVTTANGFLLPGVVGASVTLPITSAVYGIVGTGTQLVTYLETY